MPNKLDTIRTAGDDAVADAEQEATEAVALVDALEERVRNGDDSVTADQLASARELGRFARLRAEAASRKAAKAKEAARVKAIEDLAQEVRTAGTDRQSLADAFTAFEKALTALVDLAQHHDQRVTAWVARAVQLGVDKGQTEAGVTVRHGGGLTVDGQALAAVPTGALISGVVHRATRQRNIKYMGQSLAVRCPDVKDGRAAAVPDLSSLLPATVKKGSK